MQYVGHVHFFVLYRLYFLGTKFGMLISVIMLSSVCKILRFGTRLELQVNWIVFHSRPLTYFEPTRVIM